MFRCFTIEHQKTSNAWLRLHTVYINFFFSSNAELKFEHISATAPTKNVWVTCVSNGCLQGSPHQTGWTQSIELRWTIGCRSRKLCWGNVCVCDWTAPRACVNWAPRNHTQARVISVCSPGNGGCDYPLTWMFHFEDEIEIDFCLLLSESDWHLNSSDSPSSIQTHTAWRIAETFG